MFFGCMPPWPPTPQDRTSAQATKCPEAHQLSRPCRASYAQDQGCKVPPLSSTTCRTSTKPYKAVKECPSLCQETAEPCIATHTSRCSTWAQLTLRALSCTAGAASRHSSAIIRLGTTHVAASGMQQLQPHTHGAEGLCVSAVPTSPMQSCTVQYCSLISRA